MKLRAPLLSALILMGCRDPAQRPAPPPASTTLPEAASRPALPAPTAAPASAPAQTGGLTGKVLERIDAAGYSYLRLGTASGETWAAVPQTATPVGADVLVLDAAPMRDFESKTLNRKWALILFGRLGEREAAATAGAPPPPAPSAGGLPPGHPGVAPATGDLKVEKAKAANAKTVAEVWAERAKLKDTKVSVRGKVVKASNGIMGANWLHLRDGTGTDAARDNDLTVTTAGTAGVGDVVTVEGRVSVDKDFGAGYSYPVIVVEAVLTK